MKKIIKRIKSINGVLSNAIDAARIAIYDLVMANGGFVFIDESGDTIYGYALDDDEILTEYYVKGLRTCDGGDVEVYLVPILYGVQTKYTKEDIENDTDEENWYSIGGGDCALYSWETIISILESIDQYVKAE